MGGLLSIVIKVIMIYIGVSLIRVLIAKSKINTTEQVSTFDQLVDDQKHFVLTNGLKIGIGLTEFDFKLYEDDYPDTPMYTIDAKLVTIEEDSLQPKVKTLADKVGKVSEFSENVNKYIKNDSFRGLSNPEDVELYGDYYSENRSYLVFFIDWYEGKNGPTQEQILAAEDFSLLLQLYVYSPYIDFGDIETPIKYSLESKYHTYLNPKSYTQVDYLIQKNTYSLYDNYFYESADSGSFYTISNEKISQSPYHKNGIAMVTFSMDNKIINYERRVYTFIEMIGDIGGIFEVFKLLGLTIIGTYTNKLYYFYSLNQMQTQKAEKAKTQNLTKFQQNFKNGNDKNRINLRHDDKSSLNLIEEFKENRNSDQDNPKVKNYFDTNINSKNMVKEFKPENNPFN